MVYLNKNQASFSESVQMYLVTIARLRDGNQPVPLSQLAQELGVSAVSVNEMCRKLQEQRLLIYQPYKGVSLTAEGEQQGYYILRRHRLWEVFLVEKLGFEFAQAHDAACQLEHSTPDLVVARLDDFLNHPVTNPMGQLIPQVNGVMPTRSLSPLTAMSAGQSGHVVRCDVSDAARVFLDELDVRPGAPLMVIAAAEDSLLVDMNGIHISLARTLAEAIWVEEGEIERE